MDKFIELLKPKNIFKPKKRLGPQEDGGYVMPEIVLKKCDSLFTYGVAHDYRYEEDFVCTYSKPVYMFDHTTGRDDWKFDKLNFYNKGLGFNKTKCNSVSKHRKEYAPNDNIFLKIDIEGNEYEYFLLEDLEDLSKFTVGISLEIHWIDNNENRDKFISIMEKINRFFTLTHVHGNNWGGTWVYKDFEIPKVLELSFVNNSIIDTNLIKTDDTKYPIDGLDFPNNPKEPDYQLNFIFENKTKNSGSNYMEHYYKSVPSNWFDYEEVYKYAIDKAKENAVFVELGVWFGQSMSFAGVEIFNSKKAITVYGVDSFLQGDQPSKHSEKDESRYNEVLKYTKPVVDTGIVKIIKSDSSEAAKLFEDESIDFLFIDANHTYEGVKLDLESWYPKVKKGGIISGHDYIHHWEGLVKAVNEFFGTINLTIFDSSKSWLTHKK